MSKTKYFVSIKVLGKVQRYYEFSSKMHYKLDSSISSRLKVVYRLNGTRELLTIKSNYDMDKIVVTLCDETGRIYHKDEWELKDNELCFLKNIY